MHRSRLNYAEQDKCSAMALSGNQVPLMPGASPRWRRSSWSANNGNCVEVARLGDGRVGVRDSKDARGPVLAFPAGAWESFLGAVRAGKPRS